MSSSTAHHSQPIFKSPEPYKTISKLGEGAFSDVYRVEHTQTHKPYAMKKFKKLFQNARDVESLREIQALRRLNPHPNIIVLEKVVFESTSGTLCLAFELMENNLYTILSRKGTIMPESKIRQYFFQICQAMEYMHSKGIFHRDIKPENILVRETDGLVKLADFGSCRGIHSRAPYTEYIATRWYRSPECLLCKGSYNYKLDIWGAGCVLYEVLTKIPLFAGVDENDQLVKIHNIMGTPSQRLLKKLGGDFGFRLMYTFPQQEGSGIVKLLPKASKEIIELMQAMLMYDPEERITAKLALKHAFFAPLQITTAPIPSKTNITSDVSAKLPNHSELAPAAQPNSYKETKPESHKPLHSSVYMPTLPHVLPTSESSSRLLPNLQNSQPLIAYKTQSKIDNHRPHVDEISKTLSHAEINVTNSNSHAQASIHRTHQEKAIEGPNSIANRKLPRRSSIVDDMKNSMLGVFGNKSNFSKPAKQFGSLKRKQEKHNTSTVPSSLPFIKPPP